MERGNIFVEVDREEVQVSDARLVAKGTLSGLLLKIVGCIGSDGSDLFVTPGISWDEKNRNTSKLDIVLAQIKTDRVTFCP
jgi:hypothetical protein